MFAFRVSDEFTGIVDVEDFVKDVAFGNESVSAGFARAEYTRRGNVVFLQNIGHESRPQTARGHEAVSQAAGERFAAKVHVFAEDGLTVETKDSRERMTAATEKLTGSKDVGVARHGVDQFGLSG